MNELVSIDIFVKSISPVEMLTSVNYLDELQDMEVKRTIINNWRSLKKTQRTAQWNEEERKKKGLKQNKCLANNQENIKKGDGNNKDNQELWKYNLVMK